MLLYSFLLLESPFGSFHCLIKSLFYQHLRTQDRSELSDKACKVAGCRFYSRSRPIVLHQMQNVFGTQILILNISLFCTNKCLHGQSAANWLGMKVLADLDWENTQRQSDIKSHASPYMDPDSRYFLIFNPQRQFAFVCIDKQFIHFHLKYSSEGLIPFEDKHNNLSAKS